MPLSEFDKCWLEKLRLPNQHKEAPLYRGKTTFMMRQVLRYRFLQRRQAKLGDVGQFGH